MKVTAALLAALTATSLPQAAGAQSAVPPVPIDQASSRGLRICMLNLTGDLPFSMGNLEALAKAGAVPLAGPSGAELERLQAKPEGAPTLASVPTIGGRVGLAAYSKIKTCRVMVFDDPEGAARKAVLGELSSSKVWHKDFDETKAGIHMQDFLWPLKDNISMSMNVSGPDSPTDGGRGMQLMISVSYVTSNKPN